MRLDEKKLATKHVPTELNIADVGTKLMNLMGMSLVAGMECLVQQPIEQITETSIADRGMNQTVKLSTQCPAAFKPWRGLRARDLRILFR